MTSFEDASGSSLNSSPKSNIFSYLELLYLIPFLAANASWEALKNGMPFGGTLGATLMVIMSNDSGDYPFAPLAAAFLAFPVAIVCDLLFYIPCHIIRYFTQPPLQASYVPLLFS
jgi:hypothetical protein